jgi:hypothetical protein
MKPIEVRRQLKVLCGNACLSAELKRQHVDACEELCGALKWKVMASLEESLLAMKLGCTTTNGKQNEHGMASFLITKIQEVVDAAICREDYADSLLG